MKASILYIIVCCFVFIGRTAAQNYFEKLPFPDSAYIYTMDVNAEGDIFVSAGISEYETNGIYRSIDNGQTWNVVYTLNPYSNKGLDINNAGEIYVLQDWGESETLFKSTDNGETWDSLFVPIDIYTSNQEIFSFGSDTLFITQTGNSAVLMLRSINGGLSWDTLFYRDEGNAEYISDLVYRSNGEMYLSIAGFLPGDGGLFKSTDHGISWSLVGLSDFMVTDLAYNSIGDLFISTMEYTYGGVYAIFANSQNVEYMCPFADFTSIVINSSDDIYAGCFYYNAVYHTSDNCATNDWIMSSIAPENMYIDDHQYIYATSYSSLYRTVEPTITSTNDNKDLHLILYPNPCKNEIRWVRSNYNVADHYEIYDLNGRRIKQGNCMIDNGYCRIYTADLIPGTYLLKVSTNSATVFIVE